MEILYIGKHLVKQHERGFEGKDVTALVEQRLERWTHEFHDEVVVSAFDAALVDHWEAFLWGCWVAVQVKV